MSAKHKIPLDRIYSNGWLRDVHDQRTFFAGRAVLDVPQYDRICMVVAQHRAEKKWPVVDQLTLAHATNLLMAWKTTFGMTKTRAVGVLQRVWNTISFKQRYRKSVRDARTYVAPLHDRVVDRLCRERFRQLLRMPNLDLELHRGPEPSVKYQAGRDYGRWGGYDRARLIVTLPIDWTKKVKRFMPDVPEHPSLTQGLNIKFDDARNACTVPIDIRPYAGQLNEDFPHFKFFMTRALHRSQGNMSLTDWLYVVDLGHGRYEARGDERWLAATCRHFEADMLRTITYRFNPAAL